MAKKTTVKKETPERAESQIIVRQKVSDLKPNKKNEEIYGKNEDIEDLKESIRSNGMQILVPLVVTPDGLIISGHRRYKAALALKEIEEVNTIIEDVKEEDIEFRMIQYNVYRRKSYLEILNEIDKLNSYFKNYQGTRTDLIPGAKKIDTSQQIANIVGISKAQVQNLKTIKKYAPNYIGMLDRGETTFIKALAKTRPVVKKEPEFQEPGAVVPYPSFTDDYQLYNKSCKDMSEIEDNSIQLILTSPPYYGMRIYKGGKRQLGQEETPEKYVENLSKILKDCYRVLKKEGSFFLNIGDCKKNGKTLNVPHKVLFEVLKHGYNHIQTIIWAKTNATPVQNFKYVQPSYEFIFHLTKSMEYTYNEDIGRPFLLHYFPKFVEQMDKEFEEKKRILHDVFGTPLPFGGDNLLDYWSHMDYLKTSSFQPIYEALDQDEKHPAPMNSIIPVLPILLTTKPNDTVLDCFSGSATTGVVALSYGRKYTGYEISKEYLDASKERLSKFRDPNFEGQIHESVK